MAFTTTNMGLKVWNLLSDLFSHTDLQSNWNAIDTHDHSSTKGLQISTGGIANGAITNAKIVDATIAGAKLAAGARMFPNVVSTSQTTVDGNLYICTAGSITMTLPTTPPTGTFIEVAIGSSAVTGAAPVTIATGGSDHIVGPTGSATSIAMGNVGAQIALVYISSNWYIVSGQQDSGWINIALNSAVYIVASVAQTPAYRAIGDRVWFKGIAQNNTGAPTTARLATVPFAIAAAYRPAQNVSLGVLSGTPGDQCGILVGNNGSVAAAAGTSVNTGGQVWFDGLSYFIGS